MAPGPNTRRSHPEHAAVMGELRGGLAEYFAFYNGEHPQQSLGYMTPDVV